MSEVFLNNALEVYDRFQTPDVIISDGPYGLGIYPGETRNTQDLAEFYRPHVEAWTKASTPSTTLWFWNSEIGWAESHAVMREFGWVYRETTVWDKGIGHIAGKVNSNTVRGIPVTTEICVRYVRPSVTRIGGQDVHVRDWLRSEWFRSGLPMSKANEACGVKSAATRKWLTADHLWYMPDDAAITAMGAFCDEHGDPDGRPYFRLPDASVERLRAKWNHAHGVTNVWNEPAVRGSERLRIGGKVVHPNQKPLRLMERQIKMSSDPGDVIWEPFGGLFSASVAAKNLGRRYFAAEINPTFYEAGRSRLI